MKRSVMVSVLIACILLSAAAFLQASGIFPAIVPALVPSANKNGNSSVFALAATNSLDGLAPICSDASANLKTGCKLFSQTATVTVTGTVAGTSLVSISAAQGTTTLPANFFLHAGDVLHVIWEGIWNAGGTLTSDDIYTLKLGSTTVVIGQGHANFASTAGSEPCILDMYFTASTVGAGGSIIGEGNMQCSQVAGVGPDTVPFLMGAGASIDTTATQVFDFIVTPGNTQHTNITTNLLLLNY